MNRTNTFYERKIVRLIVWYLTGLGIFALVAIALICLGVCAVLDLGHIEWPTAPMAGLALGGVYLLFAMVAACRIRKPVSASLHAIGEADFPALFAILKEITETLELQPVDNVYICPEATAAVIIQPRLRNLIFEPQKELVIGLAFLTQMDDDEIRAVLYHEFGHYAQREMKTKTPVYVFDQYARGFIECARAWKPGQDISLMDIPYRFFSLYSYCMGVAIHGSYKPLSRQMEYDADAVAVRHIGASTLRRALEHALYLDFNYKLVQRGLRQLAAKNIMVKHHYRALSYVCEYSCPPRELLNAEVLSRMAVLENQGGAEPRSAERTVQQAAFETFTVPLQGEKLCSARQFSEWVRKNWRQYVDYRLRQKSVLVKILMGKKEAGTPVFDSTYDVLIDGKAVGMGNYIKGYTIERRIAPGKHELTVQAAGVSCIPFDFHVKENMAYLIEMDYRFDRKACAYKVFAESIVCLSSAEVGTC